MQSSALLAIYSLSRMPQPSASHPVNSTSTASAIDSSAWYIEGEILANKGCYSEALHCFKQVLELQPDHCAAWVFRGVMALHLEHYPEALRSCDRALEIQPSNSEAWMFRGVALHRLHRYREAYGSYDRALGKQRRSNWQRLLS